MTQSYDAILVVGFGGPEHRDDVIPFLENVTRGRNVPRERLLEVAEHYYHFGGVSPINQQVRDLIAVLRTELDQHDIALPIYWGNRNWNPMLENTFAEMKADGVQHVAALVLAAYSSYSSCRQYREDLERASASVGEGAATYDKLRVWFNHPDFIAANADHVQEAMNQLTEEQRKQVHIVYTAHSIPMSMAEKCLYETQLQETSRLVSEAVGIKPNRSHLVYQSRSGRPTDPWLEPDILDHLRTLNEEDVETVIVLPVGFLSDHMEVLFDLDEEAVELAEELKMTLVRAKTVGTHPRFVSMLRKLIEERINDESERACIGQFAASHDVCPPHCCPAPVRSERPATS